MHLFEHHRLAPYTTLNLGGPARYFTEAPSVEALRESLQWARDRDLPVWILGGGSNVVFPDAGFPGLVIRIGIGGIDADPAFPGRYRVAAGVDWDRFVSRAVTDGAAGIECLSGIPGTAGATPIQNVGAYGQEVSQTIREVHCLERTTLETRTFGVEECAFAYRQSRFKHAERDRYVVLRVDFQLEPGGEATIRYAELNADVERAGGLKGLPAAEALSLVRERVLGLRRGKSMVLDPADPNTRSAGSFFLNPVVSAEAFRAIEERWAAGGGGAIPAFPAGDQVKVPAAWLVEHAGFGKGYRRGSAGVSTRHSLALVNYGESAADL
ncbi:MAG: UDP-N-acetylmuramate dehydrogenase, partial [Gemmatimonadales bacterium]